MTSAYEVDRRHALPRMVGTTLLATALLLGGVTYHADAQAPAQKDQPAAPARGLPGLPPDLDLDDLLGPDGQLDEKQMERVRQQLERLTQEMRRAMEQPRARGGFQQQNLWPGRNARTQPANERLGARLSRPSDVLTDQLDLPQNQGLVIDQLVDDSAAAKAGVKVNDILLELNGKPVPDSPEQFALQLNDIKPNDPVDAVVLRKGRKETIKGLSLPEAKVVERQTLPVQPPLRLPRLGGVGLSITRNGEQFTVRQGQGAEVMTVTGKVVEGKATVNEVVIVEDGKTTKYDSLDKVPEAQRAAAQKLADMGVGGNIRIGR